jgi:hypothetical protein
MDLPTLTVMVSESREGSGKGGKKWGRQVTDHRAGTKHVRLARQANYVELLHILEESIKSSIIAD